MLLYVDDIIIAFLSRASFRYYAIAFQLSLLLPILLPIRQCPMPRRRRLRR